MRTHTASLLISTTWPALRPLSTSTNDRSVLLSRTRISLSPSGFWSFVLLSLTLSSSDSSCCRKLSACANIVEGCGRSAANTAAPPHKLSHKVKKRKSIEKKRPPKHKRSFFLCINNECHY